MPEPDESGRRAPLPTRQVIPGVPDDNETGPVRPKVERPNTEDLLRRMRKVDPNQARRYRQRTGQ
jgi:hypothetical protein